MEANGGAGMRWIPAAFLMFTLLVVQSAIVPRISAGPVRPDLLLIAVIWVAMHAPRRESVTFAWVLGLLADLMTLERIGLLALSYAIVAAIVAGGREYFFREDAPVQFAVTFAVSLVLRGAWVVYRVLLYGAPSGVFALLGGDILLASLYTACLAPIIHRMLTRSADLLGVAKPRYSYSGLTRLMKNHV